ncbi:glycosyltransferase [Paenibacillus rhizovicinus]|uniref:Glycosyltransferase n=1 Tax=Paenibacillus rhizovicinus TaxID=2704463 RepID=A0A6C0NZ98_9BACL|nr:glycosyltransferase [Paenibacillus rhizovicinus]QHW31548.1 glycosyltransferase [Paenibacillus rhizovicinus]
MQFTGERFMPNATNKQLEVEHRQRYLSVEPLVLDKIVLDAACGEGYGARILAQRATHVYGIDISIEAITNAELTYSASNLEFRQGSVEELEGIGGQSIDVVVSFETIEHIDETAQHKFLHEIKRVLKDDGLLVISTPDKHWYTDVPAHHNPFHVREFYKHEFFVFLKKYFSHVKFFYQKNEIVSVIGSGEGAANYRSLDVDSSVLNEGMYIVAVCSARSVEGVKLHSLMTNQEVQYHKLVSRVLSLQDEVEERNIHLGKLDQEIEEGRQLIQQSIQERAQMEGVIQSHQNTIQQQEELIQSKEETIQDYQDKLQQQEDLIQSKEETIQHYRVATQQQEELIQNKEEAIQSYQLTIQQQEELIQSKEEAIRSKDESIHGATQQTDEQLILRQTQINNLNGHIELLLQQERRLNNIFESNGWRTLTSYYKMRDALLPMNSKRRLFLRLLSQPRKVIRNLNKSNIKKFVHHLRTERTGLLENRVENYLERQSPAPVQPIEVFRQDVNISPLIFPTSTKPIVSIIIPVYNQWHYTYACLASILRHTDGIEYEVIVADDMSTDDTVNIGAVVQNIKVVRDGTNRGFLLNCNNAAEYATGRYIFFLNNDTNVQANWLSTLIDLIGRDESIGMVGSKLVYPDGRLQEAGGIIWNDASGWNFGRLDDPELPQFNYVKEVDYISGAAIMIRAELWRRIGGFDERYVPAYFEDSDLAFEVRKHGYKVMYQPQSVVVHFEGISHGTDVGSGIKSYQVENKKKFVDKWKVELQQQLENAQHVFHARDRSKGRKTMLFIDHYVPNMDKDAGSRTVFQYLQLFCNMDFNIVFLGDNFYRQEPYTSMLQQMGIEVLYGNWHARNIDQWLEWNGSYIDVTYLNRPHISIKYIDKVRKYTKSKVIYYGHDLHFLREMREYELTGNSALLRSAEEWKTLESELFNKSDISYYPSQVEIDEIKQLFPKVRARAIPAYIYDSTKKMDKVDFGLKKDLLFVGGFGHKPNVDAVLWFTKEVLPTIVEENPEIKLHVVGSNPPDEIKQLQSPSISIAGYVTDEQLAEYYRRCRIVIVPLRYGAGVKGKVVEAMFNGCPIVTTPTGSEGLKEVEGCLIEVNGSVEFAKRVIEAYDNFGLLERLSSKSIQYVQQYFTKASVMEAIQEDLSVDRQEVTS